MDYYSSQISKLIEELSKLPGIGNKTAQRLAFHIINMPEEQVERLSSSIRDAKHNVHYCKECFTLTDQELCPICRSQTRDHSVIMVVENPRDLAAYEKTGKFDGVYHVLHGAISPMLGIGPGDIRLKELIAQLPPNFIQSHRSFIVNSDYVNSYDPTNALLYLGNHNISTPVGRKYKDYVKKIISRD